MATLSCFALDTSGDLKIESGKFVVAEDQDSIKTMMTSKMNQIKGDWFLNLAEGLDYYGSILGKKEIDVELISEFKIAAINVVGVTELTEFDASFSGRDLRVQFAAGTIFSENVDFDENISGVI